MKKIYLLAFLLTTMTTFAQEAEKSGKKEVKTCEIKEGFKEPERDKKTKKWAKQMNRFNEGAFPSLEDVKNHVAIDNDCDNSEVTLMRLSEQAGNGIYVYCVKGTQLKYKRMGTVIMIEGENPFKNN
ncbi:hypothetical protein [Mariniflexile ostreae]